MDKIETWCVVHIAGREGGIPSYDAALALALDMFKYRHWDYDPFKRYRVAVEDRKFVLVNGTHVASIAKEYRCACCRQCTHAP